jgi:serine/threonine protein kinase
MLIYRAAGAGLWEERMEPLTAADPARVCGYRLQARLGAGGMGQVYLGFSPAGRAVAVKVIHPQLAADQEFVARFGQEVAAARAARNSPSRVQPAGQELKGLSRPATSGCP